MILALLMAIPVVAGFAAWAFGRSKPVLSRSIALAAMLSNLAISIALWASAPAELSYTGGAWLADVSWPWIPQLGISFHLSVDGLSLLMVVLTSCLGVISILVSWTTIRERVGFFHLNLLFVLAGVTGVFLSLDLFLFYFFWELMLVPMYFLIDVWGHENRHYAAVKFFLFTQLSGLLMLIAIVSLYFLHGRETGVYSFDYRVLLGTHLAPTTAMWLMLGFFAAFAVKLPAVPFHTWLADAHTEAPTAGSVILAGLLLKTGAYGLIRFVVPLFPGAAGGFAPIAMTLAVIGIIYGAVMAFAQTDLKRLVAYTSVSHLGFVLLGVFAWTKLSLLGAVMQMICHGISTPALFILAGALQDAKGTRDMRRMGGLWSSAPRMGGAMMFFAMASLGLPGLGNFLGELLVLQGTFSVSIPLTAVAAFGLVISTVYALWMVEQSFRGPSRDGAKVPDLAAPAMFVMASMMAALLWLGLFPQTLFDTAGKALDGVRRAAATAPFEPPRAAAASNAFLAAAPTVNAAGSAASPLPVPRTGGVE